MTGSSQGVEAYKGDSASRALITVGSVPAPEDPEWAEMRKMFVDNGSPDATEVHIWTEGSCRIAPTIQRSNETQTTLVTVISTDLIPDNVFSQQAGGPQ